MMVTCSTHGVVAVMVGPSAVDAVTAEHLTSHPDAVLTVEFEATDFNGETPWSGPNKSTFDYESQLLSYKSPSVDEQPTPPE
jgi:hypothetical protein